MRAVTAFALVLLAACESVATPSVSPTQDGGSSSPLTFDVPADAAAVAGGCGSTTVYKGGVGKSLQVATGNNAPAGVPYAIGRPAIAAAFIFGYPLHMPDSGIPYSNKILWVVGAARAGELLIEGHPLGRTAPVVRYSFPDNSGPGEIYPSGVDVPEPGCWQFSLSWSGRTAQLELEYR